MMMRLGRILTYPDQAGQADVTRIGKVKILDDGSEIKLRGENMESALNGIRMSKETFENLKSAEAKLDAIFESQECLSRKQEDMAMHMGSIERKLAEKRRVDALISSISGAVACIATMVGKWLMMGGKP